MKYAVRLVGAAYILEAVANCFQGDSARIRKGGDNWFLESSAFDVCANAEDVFPIADELLRFIHRVSALYMQLYSPFEIGYVQAFSETGVPINRALRGSAKIDVYSSTGIKELQNLRGEQSLGAAIVDRARLNNKVNEALALIGESGLQWPQLYNILEFLGGTHAIVRKKWATKEQIRKCKQTANHHRHLGNPTKYPLPTNPPSLSEATSLTLDLLKIWIASQI